MKSLRNNFMHEAYALMKYQLESSTRDDNDEEKCYLKVEVDEPAGTAMKNEVMISTGVKASNERLEESIRQLKLEVLGPSSRARS